MEILRGKHASFIDTLGLIERVSAYDTVHIDLGTGDGRFVRHIAQNCPNTLVIGIDACRENLREFSRCDSANTLFVIANALDLPTELYGLADHVTINFPWGSLLEGLVTDDPALFEGLARITRSGSSLDVRLNASALAEIGWELEAGAKRVQEVLGANGFRTRRLTQMTVGDLKSYPTTWAKRLAYGRDPRAIHLSQVRL